MGKPNPNKALLLYLKMDDKCPPDFLALKRQKITLMIEVIKTNAAMETVTVNGRPKFQEALEGKGSNEEKRLWIRTLCLLSKYLRSSVKSSPRTPPVDCESVADKVLTVGVTHGWGPLGSSEASVDAGLESD